MDKNVETPPLHVLFEKPKICNPQISPKGNYLIWLERDPSRKVLNFQASCFDTNADSPFGTNSKQISPTPTMRKVKATLKTPTLVRIPKNQQLIWSLISLAMFVGRTLSTIRRWEKLELYIPPQTMKIKA